MRALIGRVLREIANVRDSTGDTVTILSLDDAKLLLAESDLVSSGTLDQLIREQHITAQMATSLINDSGYVYDACDNLINAAQLMFAENNPSLHAAEQSIALEETEIEQLAHSSEKS